MNKLVRLVKVKKIIDDCTLCIVQDSDLPFKIRRAYYIISPQKGLLRGAHAHFKNRQILFCLKGSVRMFLDDGNEKKEILIKEPNVGIILDRMVWHEMRDMDENTLLLVLASDLFKTKDYIRDYDEFIKLTKNAKKRS